MKNITNKNWWHERYSYNHLTHNVKSLNFAKILFTITSLFSIVFFQFEPFYSPEFKVVLNLLWFPLINIGLTTSGMLIGYDYYTNEPIRWKAWMKKHGSFYGSYYFYAVLVIVIGWIAIGIMQGTNYPFNNGQLIGLEDANNVLSNGNYGWTTNPNNWYGFIVLYSLIPTQNFFTVGTFFVSTLFFFILVAPFIFNWMNRISFKECTAFIIGLAVIAIFLSTWSETFMSNPILRHEMPWFNYVNAFTNWFLIAFLFLLGFYMRKYTKMIPWKIALASFIGFALVLFAIETGLDFGCQNVGSSINQSNQFNVFYIGQGICTLPILILSYLAINIFAGYRSKNQRNHKWIEIGNRFNSYSLDHIPDQFMLLGISSRMIIGVLVINIMMGGDVQIISNQFMSVSNAVNKSAWGWILILVTPLFGATIYGLTELKTILFKALDPHIKKITNYW